MSDEAAAANQARVFFALWPEETVQSRLYQAGRELHKRLSGKLTRQENRPYPGRKP